MFSGVVISEISLAIASKYFRHLVTETERCSGLTEPQERGLAILLNRLSGKLTEARICELVGQNALNEFRALFGSEAAGPRFRGSAEHDGKPDVPAETDLIDEELKPHEVYVLNALAVVHDAAGNSPAQVRRVLSRITQAVNPHSLALVGRPAFEQLKPRYRSADCLAVCPWIGTGLTCALFDDRDIYFGRCLDCQENYGAGHE